MKLKRENVFPWENAINDLLYEMEGNEDYLKGAEDFLKLLNDKRLLNSKYQIGDLVKINFGDTGTIKNCKVIKVHFTHDKILYDVTVQLNVTHITRLYNIDSVFVVGK